ncbi:unnamed protein product [Closterium sp. Naga37s-1]|nr:unnamed protein product [Closterium sp. Naga37s-1]
MAFAVFIATLFLAFVVLIATLCLAFAVVNAFVTLLSMLLLSHMVPATIASSAFSFFLLFTAFFFSESTSSPHHLLTHRLPPSRLSLALSLLPSLCCPRTTTLSSLPAHCLFFTSTSLGGHPRVLAVALLPQSYALPHALLLNYPRTCFHPRPSPPRSAIPAYWLWLYYLSLMRYPMAVIMWAEFHHGLGPTCFFTFSSAAGVGYTASATNATRT